MQLYYKPCSVAINFITTTRLEKSLQSSRSVNFWSCVIYAPANHAGVARAGRHQTPITAILLISLRARVQTERHLATRDHVHIHRTTDNDVQQPGVYDTQWTASLQWREFYLARHSAPASAQTMNIRVDRLLIYLSFFSRPHRLHAVHKCGPLLQMLHVAWSVSVCLCVGHTGELCKHGWADGNAVWGLTLTISDGGTDHRWQRHFWGEHVPARCRH